MSEASLLARDVVRDVRNLIEHPEPSSAVTLCRRLSARTDLWIPEIMALMNASGLSDQDRVAMTHLAFPEFQGDPVASAALARCCARIGAWTFSFPCWRFPAVTFDGACLLERFGMRRLARKTDRKIGPDGKAMDDLGTGYATVFGESRIELRRSYAAVTHRSQGSEATLIVRNSSRYFGRDRLDATAYACFEPLDDEEIENLTADGLVADPRFSAWPDGVSAALPERIVQVDRMLDILSAFDGDFSRWMTGTGAVFLQGLADHLAVKAVPDAGNLPWLAWIEPGMPPWFPGRPQSIADAVPCPLPSGRAVLLSGPEAQLPA